MSQCTVGASIVFAIGIGIETSNERILFSIAIAIPIAINSSLLEAPGC